MQLWFEPGPWERERCRYPAEQMMLSLFPGERPEYPETRPEDGPDAALFTLELSGELAEIACRLLREDRICTGRARFPARALERAPDEAYPSVSHALKMAFYQAGTDLLGREPPWGALTGVRPVKLPSRTMRAGASREEAREELEEKYHVSPARSRLAVDCAEACLEAERSLQEGEVSLYIGIPFCPSRCAYCSFVSADAGRAGAFLEPYLQALEREIAAVGEILQETGLSVRTFYMGGGTPTTLGAPQLEHLLLCCREHLPLESCTEYTVEAGRPDTITREKLQVLREQGIGRISINPQTLCDEVLEAIGRRHRASEIPEAFFLAREEGFALINMDLIAGLPRDSLAGFLHSLQEVLSLGPENITVHTLALKKGSRLMEEGGALPSGEETARMVDASLDMLREAGYEPYYLYRQKYMSGALENVGWCLPGTGNLYNIAMMEELHTVISLGGGGVTKLVDRASGRILRLANPKYPRDYLASLDRVLEKKQEIRRFYGH